MTQFAIVTVVQTPAGTVLANPDGTVRSLEPLTPAPTTYRWAARPPGTAGAYEVCVLDGGKAVYNPLSVQPVAFPFLATVPNAAGAGLGVEPL